MCVERQLSVLSVENLELDPHTHIEAVVDLESVATYTNALLLGETLASRLRCIKTFLIL